jgi:hypothetical protein
MRNYLGLNALLKERWTDRGKEIPKARDYLKQLYEEWKSTPFAGTEEEGIEFLCTHTKTPQGARGQYA